MLPERRSWLLRALVFALLVGAGAWPWPPLQVGFSRVLGAIGNVLLAPVRIEGRELSLTALEQPSARTAGQNVQEDAHVVLRAPADGAEARVGISLRRDAYLPLLIFVAALLVLPIQGPAKLAALAIGIPIVIAAAIASVLLLVLFLASQAPDPSHASWQVTVVRFLFDCWLTPPGNRVIAPLLFAAGLGLLARRRTSLSARTAASDGEVPRAAGATS